MTPTDAKQHWRQYEAERQQDQNAVFDIRIAIAGSMTIEPLEAYLGGHLVHRKFKPSFTIGPFNQVRQICSDYRAQLGTDNLNVIVLLWRIEDMFPEMLTRCLESSAAVGDLLAELKGLVGAVAELRRSFQGTLIVSTPPYPSMPGFELLDIGQASLGVTLFNQGRLDEALDAFHQYVVAQPHLLEVLSARDLMGQAYARKQQWNEAADQYRTLIQMKPAESAYHGQLAECLFNLEKYREAADEYTLYLEKRPSDIDALTNLGVAMVVLGRPHEASSTFRRVVTLDPRNGSGQKNLANALVDERLAHEALPHAREAVRLLPNDAGAHEVLGRSLLLNGDPVGARAEFERALKLDPANEDARNGLANLRK